MPIMFSVAQFYFRVNQELLVHQEIQVHQALRAHQVHLGQVVWLDPKVPQVHKDLKVQREIKDHLALMAQKEVKVKKALLETRVQW